MKPTTRFRTRLKKPKDKNPRSAKKSFAPKAPKPQIRPRITRIVAQKRNQTLKWLSLLHPLAHIITWCSWFGGKPKKIRLKRESPSCFKAKSAKVRDLTIFAYRLKIWTYGGGWVWISVPFCKRSWWSPHPWLKRRKEIAILCPSWISGGFRLSSSMDWSDATKTKRVRHSSFTEVGLGDWICSTEVYLNFVFFLPYSNSHNLNWCIPTPILYSNDKRSHSETHISTYVHPLPSFPLPPSLNASSSLLLHCVLIEKAFAQTLCSEPGTEML